MVLCDCTTTTLPATGATRCGENFGQVQILAFEKLSDKQSSLSTLTNIVVKANWTAGMTAAKVQLSPEVKGWEQAGGDAVTWGEDVDPDGMPTWVRDNPVQLTVTFRGAKQTVAEAIGNMRCLAQMNDLGVYLFTTDGKVLGVDNTTLDSFPVQYINADPRGIGVRDEPDSNVVTLWIPAASWREMKGVALNKLAAQTDGDWRGIDLLAVS